MFAISGVTWIVIWALKAQAAGWWKSVKLGKLRENDRRLPRVGPPSAPPPLYFTLDGTLQRVEKAEQLCYEKSR